MADESNQLQRIDSTIDDKDQGARKFNKRTEFSCERKRSAAVSWKREAERGSSRRKRAREREEAFKNGRRM